jgi:hypothetical protein
VASLVLDMGKFFGPVHKVSVDSLCELTNGMYITFDDAQDTSMVAPIEFTGTYEDLATLIDRYEPDDEDLREELTETIKG